LPKEESPSDWLGLSLTLFLFYWKGGNSWDMPKWPDLFLFCVG